MAMPFVQHIALLSTLPLIYAIIPRAHNHAWHGLALSETAQSFNFCYDKTFYDYTTGSISLINRDFIAAC